MKIELNKDEVRILLESLNLWIKKNGSTENIAFINKLKCKLEESIVGYGYDDKIIDVDRVSSGLNKSEKIILNKLKEDINVLGSKGKMFHIDLLKLYSKNLKLDEKTFDEYIEKLKRSGDIFEPKKNFIQKM